MTTCKITALERLTFSALRDHPVSRFDHLLEFTGSPANSYAYIIRSLARLGFVKIRIEDNIKYVVLATELHPTLPVPISVTA